MSPGVLSLCGLSNLTDGCKKYWPVCPVVGGVVCVYIGRCVVRHMRRNQVQRKIHERGQRAAIGIQDIQREINNEKIDPKIAALPFTELQARLQDGSLKSEEVLKSFLAKSLEVHGRTNAITDVIISSKSEAQDLDMKNASERGLLHGIPISVKECVAVKGMDCTTGLAALIDQIRTEDSVLIQVLKSQGAVPFIKTNLSQVTFSIASINPVFGLTVHPLNEKRSPGGSSGGEGAIIGGGGSVLGVGSDIGGSIRLPAAFCGIAALKPTNGRLRGSYKTGQPIDGETIISITEGPLGRDVNAITQFMRAALSPEMYNLDPTVPPIPFREEIFRSKKNLRIGFYTYDGCIHCVPAVVRAVTIAKECLERLGHTVVPYKPYKVLEGLTELFFPAVMGDDCSSFKTLMEYDDTCNAVYDGIQFNQMPYLARLAMGKMRELTTYDPVGNGSMLRKAKRTLQDWWRMNIDSNNYRANFIDDWKLHNIDLVLCPVMSCPAMTVGTDEQILAYVTYTSIFNLANFPAGTVPVTRVTKEDVVKTKDPQYFKPETSFEKIIAQDSEGSEDLPLGVQIAGMPFEEEMVLRVMSELENALKK